MDICSVLGYRGVHYYGVGGLGVVRDLELGRRLLLCCVMKVDENPVLA